MAQALSFITIGCTSDPLIRHHKGVHNKLVKKKSLNLYTETCFNVLPNLIFFPRCCISLLHSNRRFWLVYSCCSHLEHRTSVKRFVSLQFLNAKHSVGLLERVISPSQGRHLTQTQNRRKQTSMPRVRFEPTIPAFERAKTVHALDRAATVIGLLEYDGLFVKAALEIVLS
jgi:hypothetical protein